MITYEISEEEQRTIIEELRFLNMIRLRAADLMEAIHRDHVPAETVEALAAALAGRALH